MLARQLSRLSLRGATAAPPAAARARAMPLSSRRAVAELPVAAPRLAAAPLAAAGHGPLRVVARKHVRSVKLKTRKAAAKRYKVTASGKARKQGTRGDRATLVRVVSWPAADAASAAAATRPRAPRR